MLYGMLLMVFVAMPIANVIVNSISYLSKYRGYINYAEDQASRSFLGIAFGQIIMLIFYYKGAFRHLTQSDIKGFEFHRYNLMIIIAISTFITLRFITKRFLLYSHFVNMILIASLSSFVKEKNLKILVGMSVTAVLIFFWWYIYIHKGSSETWPYRSIL